MHFYALRVVCRSCGVPFVVGGSAASDLAQWRNLTVECRNCASETPATDGVAIDLRSLGPDRDIAMAAFEAVPPIRA